MPHLVILYLNSNPLHLTLTPFLRPNKKICVVPVTLPSLVYTPDPKLFFRQFPNFRNISVTDSGISFSFNNGSLIERGRPTCSVLSLTFNKCDHLKETKSIIVPVINSRTFNDIFDEHHDFGLKNNQCKVMSQSHVVTPALTVGEVVRYSTLDNLTSRVKSQIDLKT